MAEKLTPFQREMNSRKRITNDLGVVATSGGLSAAGLKGAQYVGNHDISPGAKKGFRLVSRKAPKVWTGKAGKASAIAATTAGVVGGAAGLSANLDSRKELRHAANEKRGMYELKALKPKKLTGTVSKAKNLEQRRNKRNKAYPYLAAGGSAASAGALGGVVYGNSKKTAVAGKYNAANSGAKDSGAAATKALRLSDKRYSDATAAQTAGDASWRRLENNRRNASGNANNLNARTRNANASENNAKAMHRALADSDRATAAAAGHKAQQAGHKSAAASHEAKLAQKRFKFLPSNKKAAIGLGGASLALAAASGISHRNNKNGVTRPRHDWWQG